jgi:hypothetical protein
MEQGGWEEIKKPVDRTLSPVFIQNLILKYHLT